MTTLAEIDAEIVACQRCPLARTRLKAVPGEGPANARIMFIGEAPGWHENQQGRPFVGPAGQFLDELLASIGLKRSEVYITNIVKCRPPNNRDPQPAEIEACRDYLERQIAAICPRVIVTLGRYSLQHFLPGATISKVHGQPRTVDGRVVVPMYHPAAALHQPTLRRTVEEDFQKLPAILARLERAAEPPPEVPRQLMLF